MHAWESRLGAPGNHVFASLRPGTPRKLGLGTRLSLLLWQRVAMALAGDVMGGSLMTVAC